MFLNGFIKILCVLEIADFDSRLFWLDEERLIKKNELLLIRGS